MTRHWTALPNFVDCSVFRPAGDAAEKLALRSALGLPGDALVFISVAALKCGHKRVDYVIREFKAISQDHWRLILAGARTDETATIQALAADDPRIRIMPDTPRSGMPDLLRLADVMVLGSLFEMMPIAILEGLASGLPVISNAHPVMMWMTGGEDFRHETLDVRLQMLDSDGTEKSNVSSLKSKVYGPRSNPPPCGGLAIDMSKDGALAEALRGLTPEWVAAHGRAARERAVKMFSKEVVIGRYVEYYRQVLADEE